MTELQRFRTSWVGSKFRKPTQVDHCNTTVGHTTTRQYALGIQHMGEDHRYTNKVGELDCKGIA